MTQLGLASKRKHFVRSRRALEKVFVLHRSSTVRTLGFGARKQSYTVDERTVNGRGAAKIVPLQAKLVATVGIMANKYEVPDSEGWVDDVCESSMTDKGFLCGAYAQKKQLYVPFR